MKYSFLFLLIWSQAACMHKIIPPTAEKIPHTLETHGIKRADPYFWLREKENPKVLAYLNAENAYLEEILKPETRLQIELFQEMKSRIKENESSAPMRRGEYFYYTKYETGQQYPVFARKKGSLEAKDDILLDVNTLAKGHDYFDCSGVRVSPDQELIAYGCDDVGRRFYTLQVKNLKTGQLLPFKIENARPNIVWAADNKTFFYIMPHPETLRAEKVYRYNIETQQSELVYFEKDETFSVSLSQSLSRKYIYITSGATLTTEVRFIESALPTAEPQIFLPREAGVEYQVQDSGDRFYIITNWLAKNYRLMQAPLQQTDKKHWQEVIPHREDVYLSDITIFQNHLVVEERKEGLPLIRILDRKTLQSHIIPFSDKSYVASVDGNAEFDSPFVRFDYQSLRLPESVYDYNLKTHEQTLIKTQEIPNFNSDLYKTDRIWITARDGKKVPISLIMQKDFLANGQNPLLIYGYGSYGNSIQPWFNPQILSLVDRGFVYAIAHIRGGSDLGRDWYDQGRTFEKINTFTDFIDCTESLVKADYAKPDRVYAMGGSAGGLLMGAVANMRPDLYAGMVAQVPFVDVVTTMLDDTIPLTTFEYDEWGNPNIQKDFEYMLSYSPYDNVKKQAYPNMLITTGFHDSQVQYWEPAKWTAKLRENNLSENLILFKTDLTSGHGGASGRFDSLKDDALEYAFLLKIDRERAQKK